MTPRNRAELVEVMARAYCKCEGYPSEMWRAYDGDADAVLTALENAGCVVVPREATEEMREEGAVAIELTVVNSSEEYTNSCYTAMLKAGPYARKE